MTPEQKHEWQRLCEFHARMARAAGGTCTYTDADGERAHCGHEDKTDENIGDIIVSHYKAELREIQDELFGHRPAN